MSAISPSRSPSPPPTLPFSAPVPIPGAGRSQVEVTSPNSSPISTNQGGRITPKLCQAAYPVLVLNPNAFQDGTPPTKFAVFKVVQSDTQYHAEGLRLSMSKSGELAASHFANDTSFVPVGMMSQEGRSTGEVLVPPTDSRAPDEVNYYNHAVAVVNTLRQEGMGNVLIDLLRKFPKPDLHVHMEGILPWSDMLELLKKTRLYWDPTNKRLSRSQKTKSSWRHHVKASELDEKIIDLVKSKILIEDSRKMNYGEYKRFFDETCDWRGKIIENSKLTDILERIYSVAKRDNVRYMELMLELAREKVPDDFEDLYKQGMGNYYKSEQLVDWVNNFVKNSRKLLDEAEEHVKGKFGLDKPISDPDSEHCIRYNLEIMRTKDNFVFFAWMAAILKLIDEDPRIGGLTVVGPQNDQKAIENFKEQLAMITFLRSQYTTQHKFTYHAGELNEMLAKAEFVDQELKTVLLHGNPNRIGHAYSLTSLEVLEQLAQKGIPVEVCLVSNANLMGSKGDHPFKSMLTMGVSHILCSDNPGVHGTSLTDDYKKAVMEHNVGYQQLVQSTRNGLRHAFLEGEEIFKPTRDKSSFELRECFEGMYDPDFRPSEEARRILRRSPKAKVQYRIEREIARFEREVVPAYYNNFVKPRV